MAYKDFVKRLLEEEWFKAFKRDVLLPNAPIVPSYNPADDNTSRWQDDSAMREGYRLCLMQLGVSLDDE